MSAVMNDVKSFQQKRLAREKEMRDNAFRRMVEERLEEKNKPLEIIKTQRITIAIQWFVIILFTIETIWG
jgi:uncharacterized membrane protein (DUF106 family)